MLQVLNRFNKTIYNILLWIAMIALGVATFLVFAQTVLRYGFGISYEWLEEGVRYLVICSAFLFCGPLIMYSGHVIMDVLMTVLKNQPKILKVLDVMATLVTLVVCFAIMVWSFQLFMNSGGQTSPSKVFPMRIPYALLPIGMFFSVYYSVLKLLYLFNNKEIDEKDVLDLEA